MNSTRKYIIYFIWHYLVENMKFINVENVTCFYIIYLLFFPYLCLFLQMAQQLCRTAFNEGNKDFIQNIYNLFYLTLPSRKILIILVLKILCTLILLEYDKIKLFARLLKQSSLAESCGTRIICKTALFAAEQSPSGCKTHQLRVLLLSDVLKSTWSPVNLCCHVQLRPKSYKTFQIDWQVFAFRIFLKRTNRKTGRTQKNIEGNICIYAHYMTCCLWFQVVNIFIRVIIQQLIK